jgi:2-keto-4-pentenoate hydratase/2-oxohepta-3-ene-1,7-dioic acid hydratase in catechol pathway
MRVVSCEHNGQRRWGVIEGDQVHLAPMTPDWPSDVREWIEDSPDPLAVAQSLPAKGDAAVDAAAVRLLAPLPNPRQNVMCLGLNYAAHAEESMRAKGKALELPEHPVVFTKSTRSIAGPHDAVPLDGAITSELDWEVELTLIVGSYLHKADATTAREGILGYTVINDLSARDIQFRHKQFFLGKSLANACPMGPTLVTADEIADPQGLALYCHVNGSLKQAGNTADQVFGAVEIIRRLSWIMPLAPGDIIATGTPDGVGFARNPPEFLQPGDRVTCEVSEIGQLNNAIVSA